MYHMHQSEYVAQAVSKRAEMERNITDALDAAFEALVPLYKQDFEHQRFTRGISREGSIDEVTDNIERRMAGFVQRLRDQVFEELHNEGKLYGGL